METRPPPVPKAAVRLRMGHGAVMAVVLVVVPVVAGDTEAGEEDSRDDEQDSGHDHNPRGEPVEPIRLSRCSRRGGDRCRTGLGFRCFAHT
jgi:hypothetical protein